MIMINSSSWIMVWVGLEINMLTFIGLEKYYSYSICEFEVKYFFLQFIGSLFFIMSFLTKIKSFLFFSLMIKLNLFPFILWFIYSVKWMSKKLVFMFFFLQKIGPLILVKKMLEFNLLTLMFIFANLFLSFMYGLMKNYWISYLIYSSISQSSLMMIVSKISFSIFLIFLIYFLFIFYIVKILSNLMNMKKSYLMLLFIIISGFPLSIMFFPKAMMLINLILSDISSIFFYILVLFMAGYFYIYLKLIFFKFSDKSLKINLLKKKSMNLMILSLFFWMIFG
uniref:NADH-ubiquinone oxidoreductase chain 2 n=1 Tax=Liposcelis paeta TaxID=209927 RepID=A0A096X743_9NEOP|nr:NADH dehydrogenase subunit 2 [Liposcelis paeta]